MRNHPTSVQDAVSQIENSFDRGGNYLQNGVPKYTAHAVRMENETGITGIAGHYRFLNGDSADIAEYNYRKRFQKYALAQGLMNSDDPFVKQAADLIFQKSPDVLPEVNAEIEKLTELNPELERLNYNRRNFTEAYRALIGITSQYNTDDINAYLHSLRTSKKNTDIQKRMDALKPKGFRFGWIPSNETLLKIEAFARQSEKRIFPAPRAVAARKNFER